MLSKLYDNVKKFFLKNYQFMISLVIITIIFTIQFPYTIDAPGGYINVSKRIEVDNSYESVGSFNMAYVSELPVTIPTFIYAVINPNWDISKNKDILLENETMDDLVFRNKLALKEANNNAIINAYKSLGLNYEIISKSYYVAYIDPNSKNDLKIGDKIVSMDGKNIESKQDIYDIINSKNENYEIELIVKSNDKEQKRSAFIYELDGKKIIGMVIYEILELKTDPIISIKTSKSESGPSGGLMTTLAIYNSLTKEDITGGNLVVGTGTIDSDGNVGSIGGVKYKLIGAVKNKAKIFIVPSGENYEEALEIKKKNNYKIDIIGVSTFEETLEKLKEYNKK